MAPGPSALGWSRSLSLLLLQNCEKENALCRTLLGVPVQVDWTPECYSCRGQASAEWKSNFCNWKKQLIYNYFLSRTNTSLSKSLGKTWGRRGPLGSAQDHQVSPASGHWLSFTHHEDTSFAFSRGNVFLLVLWLLHPPLLGQVLSRAGHQM